MKLILKFAFVNLLTMTLLQAQSFKISGKVNFPQDDKKIKLQTLDKDGKDIVVQEVATNAKGEFNIKQDAKASAMYWLSVYDKQYVILAIDGKNEEITVNVDGNSQEGTYTVQGSKGSEVIYNYVQSQKKASEVMNKAFEGRYMEAVGKKDEAEIEKIIAEYQVAAEKAKKKEQAYILENFGNSTALEYIAFSKWDGDTEVDFLDKSLENYEKNNKKSLALGWMKEKAKKLKMLANGADAPEIDLADANGKSIKLSSLRGKYVLIDFWASWCGPCRQENPNVVKAYEKFKDKNFEIYGVALDQSKDKWTDAIKKDGLTWTNVSDLKYWQSAAAQTYNIRSIPQNYLLDKQGKIIAKNLRGKALEQKLQELLKG